MTEKSTINSGDIFRLNFEQSHPVDLYMILHIDYLCRVAFQRKDGTVRISYVSYNSLKTAVADWHYVPIEPADELKACILLKLENNAK